MVRPWYSGFCQFSTHFQQHQLQSCNHHKSIISQQKQILILGSKVSLIRMTRPDEGEEVLSFGTDTDSEGDAETFLVLVATAVQAQSEDYGRNFLVVMMRDPFLKNQLCER